MLENAAQDPPTSLILSPSAVFIEFFYHCQHCVVWTYLHEVWEGSQTSGSQPRRSVRVLCPIVLFYPSGRFREVLNATSNPLAPNSLSQIARDTRIAFADYIHRTCMSDSATMDASRKRKAATNATPSSTNDGSATKKIKLVVRVLLFIHTRRVRGAFSKCARRSTPRCSRHNDWRCCVCVCVLVLCQREDESSRRVGALDFEPNTAPPSYSADPP